MCFQMQGAHSIFASGATCSYNYIDLQIMNPTDNTYQLRLSTKGDWLHGSWRSDAVQYHKFEVMERDHAIRQEYWGGYSRHNSIWRTRMDIHTHELLGEEFITDNHAIMMYEPLLPNPEKQK